MFLCDCFLVYFCFVICFHLMLHIKYMIDEMSEEKDEKATSVICQKFFVVECELGQ